MALVAAQASAFDFLEALDDTGRAPVAMDRRRFGLFARQAAEGGSVTLRTRSGDLVMICGLYPSAEGWLEGWWAVGPAMRLHVRAAVRAWRQLFEQVCAEAAPIEVRAHVPPGSVAGHRVAALFGFEIAGTVNTFQGELTVWRRTFPAPQREP